MNGSASVQEKFEKTTGYYGRPVIKPHVWTSWIPLYFWVGGTMGAGAVQGLLARARGNHGLATVQKRAALVGLVVAPVALIVDLGVKHRFINMLRVFKITSPMSVGTYLLTGFGTAVGASTLAELLGLDAASLAGEVAAAALGPPLATYTAVLIADTATPIWHDARRELPFVFISSGMAGAGAVGTLFAPSAESGSARRLMIGGAIAMVLSTKWMESKLGSFLSEPYHQGRGGAMMRGATGLAIAGGALGFFGATGARIGAAAVIAAGLLERFAILEGGRQSAKDPKYVVESQRARVEERERERQAAAARV